MQQEHENTRGEKHGLAKGQRILLSGLTCIALLLCAVLVILIGLKLAQMPNADTQNTEPATAESTLHQETEPTAAQPTETQTVTVETTVPAQPEALTALLARNGTTYDQLAQEECYQLITVQTEETAASICFYTCADGVWEEVPRLACRGTVGRSGVTAEKTEGDGATPAGRYPIGSGFYVQTSPKTGLELFQITQDTYWVDDPDSAFYNQRVEGTESKDWKSAEHMISYSAYRYGFVVEYNTQAEYNAGSAIFFHIGDRPTAGCIAVAEEWVLAYLEQLDRKLNPQILIEAVDPPADSKDPTETT